MFAVDPIKNFLDIDTARIADACAVVVGHVRVDRQDGVRVTQEIGTAGVAEACAALILAGIQGKSNVVAGVTSFGLNGNCAGTGGVFRMDRQDVLDFVQPFLENGKKK